MSEMRSKNYTGLHTSTRSSCQNLIKVEFSLLIFEEYSHVKFNENPSSVSRVVLCGRTEGETDRRREKHDEANSRFS